MLSLHWKQAVGYHLTIRQMALDELIQHRSDFSLEERPLTKNAVVTIIGDTIFNLKELKERLAHFEIKLSPRLTLKTTHIVLGVNPKTTKGLEQFEGKICFLSNQQLQAVLDRLEQPYLQNKNEQTTVNIENLGDLLMSGNIDNIQLAIQIIEGGGFPLELVPHSFLAMKMAQDTAIYQSIKHILDRYLPAPARKSIRRTLLLSIHMNDKIWAKKLKKYTDGVDGLDGVAIAKVLFKYYKKGMEFIWKYSKDPELNKEVLAHFFHENHLDLSGKGLSMLPAELADYPNITSVNLQNNDFGAVPKVLVKLPALESLDMLKNYTLKNVSPNLIKMKALRYLSYHGNASCMYSPYLLKLTQLKELVLADRKPNLYPYEDHGKVKEKIRVALADCKITYL